MPSAASALVLLAAGGSAIAVVNVAGRTLLQRVSPSDVLARIFGILEGLSMVGLAVGSLLAPILVAAGGVELAFVVVGLVLPLGALAGGRALLTIDREADVPVVEIGLLRALPLFSPLDAARLEALARDLVPVSAQAAEAVITEGERGDRFYVIADGAVEVVKGAAAVATLGRGEGFGEIALLRDVPRTATCRALVATRLYALDKEHFLLAVTGHPRSRDEAQRVAETRLVALAEVGGDGPPE